MKYPLKRQITWPRERVISRAARKCYNPIRKCHE
jgi:hypothetical protein